MSEPLIPAAKQPPPPRQPRQPAQPGAGRGMKKPTDIMMQYLLQQTGGNQRAVNAYIVSVGKLVDAKRSRVVQFGNTVFLATQMGPGTIDVHIFTEESPKILVRRMQQAYAWAKQHGFQQVTSTLTDGRMAELVKASGLPIQLQQTAVNTGKQMQPAYKMTLEVK